MKDSQEYIFKLFQDRVLFEKEVLNIHNNKERKEVLFILADSLFKDTLKEHINFMYIKNVSDFTLKQIVNILFKEIANEWIDYAMDYLKLSKTKALKELQLGERIKFTKILSQDYYKALREYIFEKVADSFIDLLVFNSQENIKSVFINSVINSDLFPERRILNFNSSDQLCKAAKRAKDLKSESLKSLKERVDEIEKGRSRLNIPKVKRDEFAEVLGVHKKKIFDIEKLKLESFDETLLNVKKALIGTLKKKD